VRLSEARDEWIRSRQSQDYRPSTIEQNRRHINKLIASVGDLRCKNVLAKHVDKMLTEQLKTSGPGARGGIHYSLSSFFRWGRTRGIFRPNQDPLAERRAPKSTTRPRLIIPAYKFGQLLDAAGNRHPRDRAVIALGLYTLARQSEIKSLRIKDLDLDTGQLLMYQHKTDTHDEMPVSSELDGEMRRWLLWYTQHHGVLDREWFLVPACLSNEKKAGTKYTTDPGRGLRPGSRITAMEKVAKSAIAASGEPICDPETGRTTREGMHTLRRSAARALYEELAATGYDAAIRQVQTWLHHKSITQTEHYLQITPDRDTRNRKFRGKPMYPSLVAENVVQLREAE
jgi:integrase